METSDCMRAFLLLVFISGVHLSPDPVLTFGIKGGRVNLHLFIGTYDLVLYRIYEDGDLLLVNCSKPFSPQPDGYHITCPGMFQNLRLNNLAMSHSGDYRVELWRRRKSSPVESNIYHLTVCAEGDVDLSRDVYGKDGRAVLCEFNAALGNGSSLQLYDYTGHHLVLDTSSSLKTLVPDWWDRLQVDTNTSRVTLTGIMYSDRGKTLLCTMWRGGQCQQARKQQLLNFTPLIVTHEEEKVTLPCTFKGNFSEKVYWKTHIGNVKDSIYQTLPQKGVYMLYGSHSDSGNFSLIIPSVSQTHDGWYTCGHSNLYEDINRIRLSVCVKFSHVNVMFSHGESVLMDAHVNNYEKLRSAQWFRQKGLQPQMLITEFVENGFAGLYGVNDVCLPEDLQSRVTVFNSSTSLNISNLTAEDSGVYTWRVRTGSTLVFICHEGSIRLVYRDPFGVHSPFYRVYGSLLGCVLLGLVAAVIWRKLRSRGGALIPSVQEMEMQDIGDEDVYDDVEEVLTPGGQEMEMQDIGDEEVYNDAQEAEDNA